MVGQLFIFELYCLTVHAEKQEEMLQTASKDLSMVRMCVTVPDNC